MRGGEREFTQGALDRLLGHARTQHLPKRVEAHTLEKVAEVLRASPEPLSAEDVGRRYSCVGRPSMLGCCGEAQVLEFNQTSSSHIEQYTHPEDARSPFFFLP